MTNEVRVKVYPVVRRAVEEGAGYGLACAVKHLEGVPAEVTSPASVDRIVEAVMAALDEVIDFDAEAHDK